MRDARVVEMDLSRAVGKHDGEAAHRLLDELLAARADDTARQERVTRDYRAVMSFVGEVLPDVGASDVAYHADNALWFVAATGIPYRLTMQQD